MATRKLIFTAIFSLFAPLWIFAYNKPLVSNIKAEYANGRKINVLWTLPEDIEFPITKFLVYRDVKPISNSSDLKNAQLLGQTESFATGYTDTVDDFRDYFYAVVAYTDRLQDFIMPSMNATVKGARIKPKQEETAKPKIETTERTYPSGTLRETPLPFLDLLGYSDKSQNMISEEAKKKAENLGSKVKKTAAMLEPYYFEEDMISPDGGDAYLLFEILSGYFVRRKYSESISRLEKLIGTNISSDIENRATFYLGEAYYFTGNFEMAVRTFIKIQQTFPAQAKKWIESSLDQLEILP